MGEIHRYIVVDADGSYRNTILVDQDIAGQYWPGYGAGMIDMGPEKPEVLPPPPIIKPKDFGILDIKLDQPMQEGDMVDLQSGTVMKAAQIAPQPMPVTIDPVADVAPAVIAAP